MATAILLGGTAVAGYAQEQPALQNKTTVETTTGPKVEFLKTLKTYEQESNAEHANLLLEQLKETMMEGLRTSKAEIVKAGESGDQEAAKNAMELNRQRSDIFNQLIKTSRNGDAGKKDIVDILKSYSETL
jgi:hypothetical protein